MPRGEKKLLECLLCQERFSRHSVLKGGYYISSGICRECYKKMQKQSQALSCFGKLPSGKLYGYTAGSKVCSSICPDRVACAHFVSKLK